MHAIRVLGVVARAARVRSVWAFKLGLLVFRPLPLCGSRFWLSSTLSLLDMASTLRKVLKTSITAVTPQARNIVRRVLEAEQEDAIAGLSQQDIFRLARERFPDASLPGATRVGDINDADASRTLHPIISMR